MNSNGGTQVVPGITLSATGEVTVQPELHETLLDLAQVLEEPTGLPVDVQHVVAAIVLAVRDKKLGSDVPLSPSDQSLTVLLAEYVRAVFDDFGESIGLDD